ncbi:MAG: hypothetical protein KF729_05395 [Sandaracinaceae bacterium]|nr:hypothetical protein [Sandaracinaceae bacterium]
MTRAWLAGALLVALPSSAAANEVVATPCDGSTHGASAFSIFESVCVAGAADLECDGAPGADVYVVPHGAEPWAGRAIRVDASFADVLAYAAPLAPGEYDLFLDEGCDGEWTEDDLHVERAFEVFDDLVCRAPGPPLDPGLENGATCRGACGAGCPSSCTLGGAVTTCVEGGGRHQTCTFETLTCSTHEACRAHDECYDGCDGFWCQRQCDLGCVGRWGLACGAWATGRGPSDGSVTYWGHPVTAGATEGACGS